MNIARKSRCRYPPAPRSCRYPPANCAKIKFREKCNENYRTTSDETRQAQQKRARRRARRTRKNLKTPPPPLTRARQDKERRETGSEQRARESAILCHYRWVLPLRNGFKAKGEGHARRREDTPPSPDPKATERDRCSARRAIDRQPLLLNKPCMQNTADYRSSSPADVLNALRLLPSFASTTGTIARPSASVVHKPPMPA